MLTELRAGCSRICEVYVQAPERWAKKGVKTISVDEKTGMQALERNAPDLPLDIGKTRKREFEYTRHGTQCLLANWDVVRSGIICPTIGDTRNEEGFQQHIQKTTQSDPTVQQWCIVLDNLNPHQSEAFGALDCCYGGHGKSGTGRKGEKRHPEEHGKQGRFLVESYSSGLFCLHAKTLFVAPLPPTAPCAPH